MNELSQVSAALADAVEGAAGHLVTVHGMRPISGVVVGAGQVLTVAHVLPHDEVRVTAGGQDHAGQVAGRDPVSDLALVKVDGLAAEPMQAASGRVGELVLAVARPQPGRPQASFGVLSDLGEPGRQGAWLRTDARPAPGFSGGLLVSAAGAFLGVLNAGLLRGQLYAVPAARALEVAALLAGSGRVPRGFLGLSTQPVRFPRGGAHRWGLTVVGVEAGSPAEAGGLLVGDILLGLDGQPLGRPDALLHHVRERAGETVTFTLMRGGQEQNVPVTLGER